jgi:hypothetical protein
VYTEKDGSNAPSPKALTIKFHWGIGKHWSL